MTAQLHTPEAMSKRRESFIATYYDRKETTNVDEHIGQLIYSIRTNRQRGFISRKAFGAMIGRSVPWVRNMEQGKTIVSATMLVRMAAALDLNPSAFLITLPGFGTEGLLELDDMPRYDGGEGGMA